MCRMISYYNAKSRDEMYLPLNIIDIVSKRINLQGFIVGDPDFAKYAGENVSRWLKDGEIVVKETVARMLLRDLWVCSRERTSEKESLNSQQ